jgi:putative peptide-modifying radical SAM enzyme
MHEFDNGLGDKFDYDMETPVDSEVSVEKLKEFLKPDDTLIFYGGEPLVRMEKMIEIMDGMNCHFMIQTNGMLLDKLPTKYLLRLDKMLVSIDGTKERDNLNKGILHYDKIISNLKDVRSRGYKGEIVARMVISESDVYEQVMHIVELINQGLFDSVHWQIDAGFYKFDFDKEKFSEFVEEYNDSIDELLDFWIREIEKGVVWRFYPFLGILGRLMGWDGDKCLPCGAGVNNFTINTCGKLSACPIMNSVKNLYCGDIKTGVDKEINVRGCGDCSYLDICGGRCLYWREAKLWPKEGDDLICDTIKHLIDGLRGKIPRIKELLGEGAEGKRAVKLTPSARTSVDGGVVEEGTKDSLDKETRRTKNLLRKEDFDFEKYFGPEIIP